MAIAVGLAVALSKSPTPQPRSVSDTSAAKAALGYDLPPPISHRPPGDALGAAGVLRRLPGRGRVSGTPGRSTGCTPAATAGRCSTPAAWYAGLVVVLITTQTGVNRYGEIMFSVHMAQHMLLSMVAPPLLALGAPITLALRYLPDQGPAARGAGRPRVAARGRCAARSCACSRIRWSPWACSSSARSGSTSRACSPT